MSSTLRWAPPTHSGVGRATGGQLLAGGPARPYFPLADWLWQALPASPTVHSNSATWVAALAGGGESHSAQLHDYATTVVTPAQINISTPRYTLPMTAYGFDAFAGLAPPTVPIPTGTQVPPLTTTFGDPGDGHGTFMDSQNNLVYSCWQLTPATDPRSCSYGGAAYLNGDGREFVGSSTATNISRAAGVIRAAELTAAIGAGTGLGHTLFFSSKFAGAGYVYPAQKSDGTNTAVNIPEGTRVQLDPTFNVATMAGSAAEKVIARTLQTHGAVLGDKGGAAMAFIFEYLTDGNPGAAYVAAGMTGDYFEFSNIPWSSLRVMDATVTPDPNPATTKTATDSGAGVDTSTAVQVATTRTDTATGVETAASTATLARSDTATGVDAAGVTAQLAAADTAAGVDLAQVLPALGATDVGAGVETSGTTAQLVATDSATAVDSAAVAAVLARSDSAAGADVAQGSTAQVVGADSAGALETAALGGNQAVVGNDTATLADSPAAVLAQPAAADSATGADTSALAAASTRPDTAAGADVAQVTAALTTRTDTATGVDQPAQVLAQPAGQDSGSGADVAQLAVVVAALDAGAAVETAGRTTTGVNPDTFDAGTAADSATVLALVAAAGDGGGGLDQPAAVAAVLARSDSATAVDLATLGGSGTYTANDTATGVDLATVAATLGRSDSGAGLDSAGSAATATAADSGTAADSAQLLVIITAGDVAAATDTAVVLATYTRADSGAGIDQATVTAAGAVLVGVDGGTAADSAGVQVYLARSDQGTGVDDSHVLTGGTSGVAVAAGPYGWAILATGPHRSGGTTTAAAAGPYGSPALAAGPRRTGE